MQFQLCFKDKITDLDLPGIPNKGDFIRTEFFGIDLCVDRIVWTQKGIVLELVDPFMGHKWAQIAREEWNCGRCGWTIKSKVPPGYPGFPFTTDCDDEIARCVHSR